MVAPDSENELSRENESSDDLLFTLLREEATDIDSFEDKTHEKIAETLYKLIKKEKRGLTIGLEGTWGSGKSVVISILRKKLRDEQKISFFSFDAWAHEGDPLRRIFLESLIEDVFLQKDKAVKDLQGEIAKRIKHCDITSTKSATGLGKALAVAAFFIPLGLGLMAKAQGVTFELGGQPHWSFLFSSCIAIAPIWVLVCNLIHLLLWKTFGKEAVSENDDSKKIFAPSNWAFMQGESTEDVTQEVSEDEERSSIEFANYFQKIITLLFDNKADKRLVMVIDNLDRVDAQDSLKIWSTLQTFLQQRNTPSNKKDWFEGIWVIVPYDPEGLAKLWDTNEEAKVASTASETKEKENRKEKLSDQFFDKCFQLKLEVPKPILTAWEQFAEDRINEAFAQWDNNERKKVLDILELTRKTLNDIPTPRQIKNYINQVGLLRVHSSKDIPTESIAYYVIQRILEKQSVHEIREKLLSRELPEPLSEILPESCGRDMAGLIFGVSPIKGQQLLLEPDIQSALKSANGEELKELQEKHSKGFWAVFDLHIQNKFVSFEELLSYSKAIHDGLWEIFKGRLAVFSKRAQKLILVSYQ